MTNTSISSGTCPVRTTETGTFARASNRPQSAAIVSSASRLHKFTNWVIDDSRYFMELSAPCEYRPALRHGNAVILEPIAMNWGWLDEVIGPVAEDFAQAAAELPGEQSRSALDVFR